MSGTGDRSLSLGGDATAASTFNADVGDPASGQTTLVKDRSCTWIIGASAALTYSGGTFLRMGTLRLATGAALPSGAGKGNVTFDTSTDFNSAYPAVLDLNGNDAVINGLAGGVPASTYSSVTNAVGVHTLTVGANGATATFDGLITGGINLVKTSTGKQTLTGASTYTGTTTVAGGTLVINGLPTGTGVTTVNAAGPVLAGTGTLAGPVVVAGLVTAGSGATSGDTIGTLTLNAGLTSNNGGYAVKMNPATATAAAFGTGKSGTADVLVLTGLTIGAGKLTIDPVPLATGTFTTGATYSFAIADATGAANVAAFDALISSGKIAVAQYGTFNKYQLDTMSDGSGGEDLLLDFTAAATPEPTSLVLLAAAVAPLAFRRRGHRVAVAA